MSLVFFFISSLNSFAFQTPCPDYTSFLVAPKVKHNIHKQRENEHELKKYYAEETNGFPLFLVNYFSFFSSQDADHELNLLEMDDQYYAVELRRGARGFGFSIRGGREFRYWSISHILFFY